MTSPTKLTLKLLRDEGGLVEVVERFVKTPGGGFRKDLFGFIDVLSVHDGITIAVQTTSKSNMSSRRKKILTHENYLLLKESGWVIELHGWWQDGKGKRYQLKREIL